MTLFTKKAPLDPIEAAKRTADGKQPDPIDPPDMPPQTIKEQIAADTKHMSTRMAPRTESPADVPIPDEVAAIQAAAAAPPTEKVPKKKYRVLEKKMVAVHGTHVFLKKGMELDPVGYGGEEGIKKMIDGGLEVEEFEG